MTEIDYLEVFLVCVFMLFSAAGFLFYCLEPILDFWFDLFYQPKTYTVNEKEEEKKRKRETKFKNCHPVNQLYLKVGKMIKRFVLFVKRSKKKFINNKKERNIGEIEWLK